MTTLYSSNLISCQFSRIVIGRFTITSVQDHKVFGAGYTNKKDPFLSCPEEKKKK
ncbi:hypothetical protein HYPBUDRAFT_151578 [Hyphopichia burtonii NRRL Y-1933]|uniref:Uncharacterized protein n=1 Tax=Hyphopichia burtonii NRRL Y-1933 TaxID=984485 RepID=A0A1E4RS88_9ASCO|nr:hypothetical protein HYPBUDRAFT_151578 [Hyphopichia burtonii NRRL Y-1933]ODV70117.1 hypothetical protein HYPBUDRAFT_151578 [Hyphopichia burtonii NRRL Y-1933]